MTRLSQIKIICLSLLLLATQVINIHLSLGVGKSCLLSRVMDNDFKEEHNVTIGVEFGSFVVKIDGKIVKL